MQITYTKTVCGPATEFNGYPGDVKDVPASVAKDLMEAGAAIPAKPEEKQKKRTASEPQGKVEKRG